VSGPQRLLLITPVHNEAPHLRQVVRSVADQTRPPDHWVVVDDNSSDGSGELLREILAPLSFATLVATDPAYTVTTDGDRNAAGGPDRAWNYGLQHADLKAFTHVGKLDGDIVLPPDYLEALLARFTECPRLGMAAGTVTERRGDHVWVMPTPADQVTAPARLYSVECFTAIGGMPPYMGADVVTTVYAKMRGFDTVTFAEWPVLHLRPMATADGLRRGRERQGAYQYVTHYSFPWVFVRSFVVGARFRPRGLSGAWFLLGYVKAALRRQPRVEDPAWQEFARAERRTRVAAAVRHRLPGSHREQRAGAT
jgi:biofilm PGA synthesis N-glycosyltransferase PgaC